MRAIIAVLFVAILSNFSFAETLEEMPLGLPPMTAEDRAKAEAHMVPKEKILAGRKDPLPERVVNHEFLPVVDRQLIGSCTSWALAYYLKGYQEARERGWEQPSDMAQLLSPAMPYNVLATSAHSGVSIGSVCDFLVNHGTCSFEEFPETISIETIPGIEQWKHAAAYRSESWSTFESLPEDGHLPLKTVLASGELAVGRTTVTQNVQEYRGSTAIKNDGVDNGVIYDFTGGLDGFHAICFIGYDDNMAYFNGTETRHGAFLVVNSWGQDWGTTVPEIGTGGFVWLAYDLIDRGDPHLGDDMVVFYTMADRIGQDPDVFAILDFRHSRRFEMNMSFFEGGIGSPAWSRKAVLLGGSSPIDCEVAVDLTDHYSSLPFALGLRISDALVPLPQFPDPATGVLRDFRIEDSQGRRLVSADTPLVTTDIDGTHLGDFVYLAGMEQGEQGFPAKPVSSAAAADIDLDGDVDFVLDGQLYINDGNGSFTPSNPPLARTVAATGSDGAAWGDFNHDGLPDLAQAIHTEGTELLEIAFFVNEGNGRFRENFNRIQIDNWRAHRLHWIDWNSDGVLDLATSTDIYIGSRAGTWQKLDAELPELAKYCGPPVDINNDGVLDWGWYERTLAGGFNEWSFSGGDRLGYIRGYDFGDFDSDGLPDIALMASVVYTTPTGNKSKPVLRLYKNSGTHFQLHQEFDGGLEGPAIRWVDINNDGLLDIVYTATNQVALPYSTRWIPLVRAITQHEGGRFQECVLPIDELGNGALLLLDAENDGDLDMIYTGSEIVDADHPFFYHRGALAINRTADARLMKTPNHPPSAPVPFPAEVADGTATFRWQPSTDAETPAENMEYRLRVGTFPGGNDIVSGAPPVTLGTCRMNGGALGTSLNRLAPGRYYWNVQAVDAGLMASPWSLPQTFDVVSSPHSHFGDTNLDGKVDAADVVRVYRDSGKTAASPSDIDADGSVTAGDAALLANYLTGGSGSIPDDITIIGPGGGELIADGFRLSVPAGAFDSPMPLRIIPGSIYEIGSDKLPVVYTVTGMPASWNKPLELWLRDTRTYYITPPLMAFGIDGFSHSIAKTERTYRFIPPDRTEGDQFLFRLDPPDFTAGKTAAEEDWTFEFSAGVLGGYYNYTTDHFRIGFPADSTPESIEKLGRNLEDAYNRFIQADLGFSYSRRTRWPVDVAVRNNLGSTNGYQTNDIRGINYGMLTFNASILNNDELCRVTAGHEFFHLVQSFYDPRNRFSMAWYAPPHLWVDEAASVWSEELFSNSSGTYLPDVANNNMTHPFPSFPPKPGLGSAQVASHGYGSASVIRFLQNSPTYGGGSHFIRNVYTNIRGGKEPHQAIDDAAAYSSFLWLRSCYTSILKGDVYPFDHKALIASLSPNRQTLRLAEGSQKIKAYEGDVYPLGSKLFRTYSAPDYDFNPGDAFVASLTGECGMTLSLLSFNKDEKPVLIENAIPDEDGRAWINQENISAPMTAGTAFIPVVTCSNDDVPTNEKQPFTLTMGIANADPIDYAPWNVVAEYSAYTRYASFPTIAVNHAILDAGLVSEETRDYYDNESILIAIGTIWGPYPRDVEFTIDAEITTPSISFIIGKEAVSLTASGPTRYRFRYGWTDKEGVYTEAVTSNPITPESPGNALNFTIPKDAVFMNIQADVLYTVTETITTIDGKVINKSTASLYYPVFASGNYLK